MKRKTEIVMRGKPQDRRLPGPQHSVRRQQNEHRRQVAVNVPGHDSFPYHPPCRSCTCQKEKEEEKERILFPVVSGRTSVELLADGRSVALLRQARPPPEPLLAGDEAAD